MKLEPRGLDLFVLLDRSAPAEEFSDSWELLRRALSTFVISPYAQSIGVGVGLGYFPSVPASCNMLDYARPDVPITLLPGGSRSLMESLAGQTPGGARPTGPALAGAFEYATAFAAANPRRKTIVVLATDGEPLGCADDAPAAVEHVARVALDGPLGLRTYVVGSRSSAYLNELAQAGGTEAVFVAGPGDAGQLDDSLFRISRAATRCEFERPPVEHQADRVNVFYESPIEEDQVLFHTGDAAGCAEHGGGWFYRKDLRDQPVAIELCPTTCDELERISGSLKAAIGCHTF